MLKLKDASLLPALSSAYKAGSVTFSFIHPIAC